MDTTLISNIIFIMASVNSALLYCFDKWGLSIRLEQKLRWRCDFCWLFWMGLIEAIVLIIGFKDGWLIIAPLGSAGLAFVVYKMCVS